MNFCGNCGSELGGTAKFCHSCGASVSPEVRKVSAEGFFVKPVFEPVVIFMRLLPLGLCFGIWLGGFLGTFGTIAADKLGMPPFYGFIFSCIAGFFIPVVGIYISMRNNYKKTTYEFLYHRLTYYEGFWSRSKKELRYISITEIGYNEGIFQRKFKLGTIVISTPATDKKAGLYLKDIRDVELVYAKFKERYDATFGFGKRI